MTKKRTTGPEKAIITTLTPDAARRLLANNTHNRALRPKLISRLATTIREGRWKVNGASVVVDSKGRLLDGQHRCHAVVRADMPVKTVLVTGVSPSAFDTIDQGAKRTGGDIFHLCGVKNPSVVSSSIAIVWQNRKGIPEGSDAGAAAPDMDQRVALFDSIPYYEDVVSYVTRYRTQLAGMVPLPMMAGLYFLFQEKHERTAQAFLAALCHAETAVDNPAYQVRRVFEDLAEEDYRISRQARAAYLKLAWNAFAAGQRVDMICLQETLDIPINKPTSDYWLKKAKPLIQAMRHETLATA